jgi:hypothetical protein
LNKTIIFSELNQFYEELDQLIASHATVRIVFHSTPPNPFSDLWRRLQNCRGYSQMIPADYMVSRPELMPPFLTIQGLALFFPLVNRFFKFHGYRKYKLHTQRQQVGKLRRIVLAPR